MIEGALKGIAFVFVGLIIIGAIYGMLIEIGVIGTSIILTAFVVGALIGSIREWILDRRAEREYQNRRFKRLNIYD